MYNFILRKRLYAQPSPQSWIRNIFSSPRSRREVWVDWTREGFHVSDVACSFFPQGRRGMGTVAWALTSSLKLPWTGSTMHPFTSSFPQGGVTEPYTIKKFKGVIYNIICINIYYIFIDYETGKTVLYCTVLYIFSPHRSHREVWLDWTRAHPDLPELAYDARVLHATFREFETLELTVASYGSAGYFRIWLIRGSVMLPIRI